MTTEYKPHSELVETIRDGLRYSTLDQTPAADAAWALAELVEQYEDLGKTYDQLHGRLDEFSQSADFHRRENERLKEQLEAAQKAQHVQNLEWAISLAESDPLYAEVFRPYFQKIVDALASNPASERQ